MTATLKDIIARAKSQVGGYFPGKSPYGVWYDNAYGGNKGVYDAAQFCYMGLSWVFAKEGAADIFPVGAYTPSGVAAWKARGQWHEGTKGIQPGDILYFDFPGAPNRVSHTGIATSSWKSGVDTIEFNTSGTAKGDQRNGRVVARKRRTLGIVGYGRPKYASASKPPASGSGSESRPGTMPKPGQSKKPFIIPTMKKGDESSWVKLWQSALHEMGYRLDVDGKFGPDTTRVTKNFQAAVGLKQDGVAGPDTVSAALLRDGDRRLSQGDTGADVGLLQHIVDTPADRSFGPKTEAETKEVQRYFEISADGVVGPDFVRHYRKAAK